MVEFQLKVDIIPLPGLKEVYGFDGFTSADLKEISVDLFAYQHRPRRYRFTLAHEVGHIMLHTKLFREHPFRSCRERRRLPKTSRLRWWRTTLMCQRRSSNVVCASTPSIGASIGRE